MDAPDIRTTAAFALEGWSPRDLSRAVAQNSLERVRRGVYAPPSDLDERNRYLRLVSAVCQAWHPDCVVSHGSAALLHGLPVRQAAVAVVHLSRDGAAHGKTKAGVRLHRVPVADSEVEVVDGLRVTSLERTLADLARIEPFSWGVAAADAALRRQPDPALLREYVDTGRRRPGNHRLRQVLEFADARAESALESMSRVSIARAGLPKPELQVEITRDGEWVATSDFAWRDPGVVGEADGKGKYTDDPDRGRTAGDVVMVEKRRDQIILDAGWWPTHWGWDLATDHLALGRHLRNAFRRAA